MRDYLALEPEDALVMDAVIEKSIELREAEHKGLLDYLLPEK